MNIYFVDGVLYNMRRASGKLTFWMTNWRKRMNEWMNGWQWMKQQQQYNRAIEMKLRYKCKCMETMYEFEVHRRLSIDWFNALNNMHWVYSCSRRLAANLFERAIVSTKGLIICRSLWQNYDFQVLSVCRICRVYAYTTICAIIKPMKTKARLSLNERIQSAR